MINNPDGLSDARALVEEMRAAITYQTMPMPIRMLLNHAVTVLENNDVRADTTADLASDFRSSRRVTGDGVLRASQVAPASTSTAIAAGEVDATQIASDLLACVAPHTFYTKTHLRDELHGAFKHVLLTPAPKAASEDGADLCRKDGQPCYVGRDTDDAHYRCGTVQCGMRKASEDGATGLRREALQEAHDTLHECTAVLTADDCRKVAAVMERCRAALATPSTDATGLRLALSEIDNMPHYWSIREAQKVAGRALAASPTDATGAERMQRYRHKARGTEYDLIGTAELQDASGAKVEEGALLAIYRGEDGKLWARRHTEFGDGRFERIRNLSDDGETM